MVKPGYYWLAYSWDNLLLSCQLCNQRYKRNLFPLREPTQRATSHHDDLAEEKPLFIHPAQEEPVAYIGFRSEIAFPIGDNVRGRETIESLGLNRQPLQERRLEKYEILKTLSHVANLIPPTPESAEAQTVLAQLVQDRAEYAAMARAVMATVNTV